MYVWSECFNFPNSITLVRLLLVAPFCASLVHFRFFNHWTLLLLGLILLTDFLDGYVARLHHQETELGKVLDPIADFVLIFFVMLTLTIYTELPPILFVLYLVRVSLLTLQLSYYRHRKKVIIPMQSRMLGKITFVSILSYLTLHVIGLDYVVYPVDTVLRFTTVLLMIISWLDYAWHYYDLYRMVRQTN
mgnify:CR=1 FL=1